MILSVSICYYRNKLFTEGTTDIKTLSTTQIRNKYFLTFLIQKSEIQKVYRYVPPFKVLQKNFKNIIIFNLYINKILKIK